MNGTVWGVDFGGKTAGDVAAPGVPRVSKM
jgi:hypothetical protein